MIALIVILLTTATDAKLQFLDGSVHPNAQKLRPNPGTLRIFVARKSSQRVRRLLPPTRRPQQTDSPQPTAAAANPQLVASPPDVVSGPKPRAPTNEPA